MLLYGVALVLLLGVSVSDASEAVFHSDTVVNPVVDAGGERVDDVVKCASETRNLTFFPLQQLPSWHMHSTARMSVRNA